MKMNDVILRTVVKVVILSFLPWCVLVFLGS